MDTSIKKGDYLDILLRSKKTVFSTKDIALLWRDPNMAAAQVRLNLYIISIFSTYFFVHDIVRLDQRQKDESARKDNILFFTSILSLSAILSLGLKLSTDMFLAMLLVKFMK